MVLAAFAFAASVHAQETSPTLMDTARTIIARLFPQRSPTRARSRPQKPKRYGAQGTSVFIDVLPRVRKPRHGMAR
jgi:hypothetical protein